MVAMVIVVVAFWAFFPLQISFKSAGKAGGETRYTLSLGPSQQRAYADFDFYAALVAWFNRLYTHFMTNLMTRVQDAITNKLSSLAHEIGGITGMCNLGRYGQMLGLTDFGGGLMGHIGGMTSGMMSSLSNQYSILTPSNLQAAGQDGYTYLGVSGHTTSFNIGQEALREAGNNDTTLETQLSQNSPYAPTFNWMDQNNMDVAAYKQQVVRYTKTLTGDPVDLNSEVKGEDPVNAQITVHDLAKANVEKKLASDIASSAAANIYFAKSTLKQLQTMQVGQPADSETTTVKDMAKIQQLQTILLAKLLITLSQQEYGSSEELARIANSNEREADALHARYSNNPVSASTPVSGGN